MNRYLESLLYRNSFRPDLTAARLALSPFSLAYSTLMILRRKAYRAGWLPAAAASVPVISIGNLTLGGTGKTPLTMAVARMLREAGRAPAVITRGYGSQAPPGTVVSDGTSITADASVCGDEPLLMARELSGVPVIINPDREAGARQAVAQFDCGCILLDDGFQHMALARDLNILALDASSPLGNGCVLPAGPLREPVRAARDADLVIFTKTNQADDLRRLERMKQRLEPVPVLSCAYHTGALCRVSDNTVIPADTLSGLKAVTVSGLARPASFETSAAELPVSITAHHRFPDHHRFTAADEKLITDSAGPEYLIITSAKDAVRLPDGLRNDPRMSVLGLTLDFGPDLPVLTGSLEALFAAGK